MGERLERALAEADEIEAAEADQTDRPLPAHVKASRPGHARSKVLQVRLNPEEYDALEAIARRRNLPVSTVARAHLLQLILEDRQDEDDVATRLEGLGKLLVATAVEIRSRGPNRPLTSRDEGQVVRISPITGPSLRRGR
ncbi:ribbon-helix-helix domain-containing protein [Mycolicibacterium phlei]|uniref:ribbon-helix-helix domain-containing protein n=1 Tax=Mycolicibacterium phlei TaxID=1771 RepID=UPI001E2BFBEE|nr:ribbon-helix-helix domain-containing protein [Mycolicibacterium phlei]MBF4194550.1 hypothetical protein [Mycolicibacterium phlei]